ncbi:MAG: hypothetical protein PHQ91_15905 [Thermoanaerobaculaceae bacterium]|nr:hypothetical protein [Thermoanaerobaculaceae bacterium]
MKAKELRDGLNQFIDQGHGNAEVLFDTEAMCFDVHAVHIRNVFVTNISDKNEIILTYEFHNTPCHYNNSVKSKPLRGD